MTVKIDAKCCKRVAWKLSWMCRHSRVDVPQCKFHLKRGVVVLLKMSGECGWIVSRCAVVTKKIVQAGEMSLHFIKGKVVQLSSGP